MSSEDTKTITIQKPPDGTNDHDDEEKEKNAEIQPEIDEDLDELFHVYSGDKISGPHYPHEIMKMICCGEISYVFWVIRAHDVSGEGDDKDKWCKLHLSHEDSKDTEGNNQLKNTYLKLYQYLDSKLKAKKLEPLKTLTAIPEGTESAAKGTKRCVKIVGVILFVVCSVIIGLHALVPGCCTIVLVMYVDENDSCGSIPKVAVPLLLMLSYSGLIIIPLIIVYVVFLDTVNAEEWNSQIQSWMIAYIAWGISSYLLMTLFLVLAYLSQLNINGDDLLAAMYSGIFWIIGVDLGDVHIFDLFSGDEMVLYTCFLWVFPCLASLLPSAIIGFIANFILEEKYELKCNDDIENGIDTLCFDDGLGCCEVVSSHDYHNMYSFLGGLASNILAIWAIIRIVGFLIASASPKAGLYAKKKKIKRVLYNFVHEFVIVYL
eukprot:155740_1